MEFTVEKYLNGVRVDSFLAKHLRNYTTWRIARMVRAGLVTMREHPVCENQRVFQNDIVRIELNEPPDKLHSAETTPLDIIYDDPWLLVVNKPPGMITHPVGEFQEASLCNVVQNYLDQQSEKIGLLRPGIVHRLDRQTSGIILVAKEHLAHRKLSIDFQRGRIEKQYLAIVEGIVANDQGTINLPIGRHPQATALMSVASNAMAPKMAVTHWKVHARLQNQTVLIAKPETGRNHQIRIHFAAIGHPLIDEPFYLKEGNLRPLLSEETKPSSDFRHALHACALTFRHPITQTLLTFTAPLAADLLCKIQNHRA